MLYNSDEVQDLINVLGSIDGFAEGFELKELTVDQDKLESILKGMRFDFPAQGGTEAASPFKKAANFFCYFVAERPIKNPFPEQIVGPQIATIENHQNVMVGLHIALDALHNATLHKKDGSVVVLMNRIQMSMHSYVDTIQACSKISPASHFHLVSVFLEQMCYRFNEDACYKLEV